MEPSSENEEALVLWLRRGIRMAVRVRIIPFFDYPPEIRKIIYTTNAIESVNMSLRKVTKSRVAFPND
ncbi:transposase [Candidatus Nitrotoga sp. 1052]|nr:transposase [Candidatus Nitrotoga sp. 1052]